MISMAKFGPEGVQVLDESGWRSPDHDEWIDIGGGNCLIVNGATCLACGIQGFAAGILCALVCLGVYAGAVL